MSAEYIEMLKELPTQSNVLKRVLKEKKNFLSVQTNIRNSSTYTCKR